MIMAQVALHIGFIPLRGESIDCSVIPTPKKHPLDAIGHQTAENSLVEEFHGQSI